MKRLITVLCLIIVCITTPLARSQVSGDMPLFSQSVTSTDNAAAGLLNPAALAPRGLMGLRYMHAFTDSTFKGNDAVLLASRGTMVAIQWLKHTNNIFRRKYLIASGRPLFPRFYWGLSYAWFGGANDANNDIKYNKKKVWKFGTLYQLNPLVAMALVVDDLTRTKFGIEQTERRYTLGAGVTTAQNQLTFSVDTYFQEKSGLDDTEAMFRIAFRKKNSFLAAFDIRTDGMMRAGFAFFINNIDIGLGARADGSDYQGGNFYYNQGPTTQGGGR